MRTLVALRYPMTEVEATAWADAWIDAGKPALVEPWVYLAISDGARYDVEAKAIVQRGS